MMDKDYLYQIDIREWIERGLDADIMVPVSGNKIDKKYDIYLQSFLLPLNEVENDMENDTYNAHTLMPGITVYGSWEDDEKVYHRWGNDNGYEPLVIKREYNGVATDSIEIVEEFRLLFNLYFNSQKNEYIDVSNGEGITVVKMNDSVMMVGGAPPMPGSPNAVHTITLNTDFYHLLVVGDDELNPQYCHCLVRKDRAITESTSKELKAAYAALSEDAISVLKTYPAIIATENHTYGKTDEDHYAAYGLIVDVKIQDNGIKVYYQILNWIPQQKINELRFELGIEGCSGTNELNRMHWAIKKINAVEVLREAGIQVFSL